QWEATADLVAPGLGYRRLRVEIGSTLRLTREASLALEAAGHVRIDRGWDRELNRPRAHFYVAVFRSPQLLASRTGDTDSSPRVGNDMTHLLLVGEPARTEPTEPVGRDSTTPSRARARSIKLVRPEAARA